MSFTQLNELLLLGPRAAQKQEKIKRGQLGLKGGRKGERRQGEVTSSEGERERERDSLLECTAATGRFR